MKTKLYTFLLSSLLCTGALADNEPWQNPQINEMNREPMHAHFTPFTNEANALKQRALPADVRFDVNPATERRITLDGTWKFLFSKNNDLCPKDFHKPGFSTRKWSKIEVPGSWELQGFDAPIYTDTRYPFPPNPPYVPTDYNPVGAYIREFTVPASWEGMDIFLNFEGVESAYYVWVNGELAGYAEDSRLPSHFNITHLLKKGNNKLAVKVFRYSDGSYLEGQDYWKYSGIERSVYLYARPQSRVKDFRMTAELINNYKDGELKLDVFLHRPKAGETVEVKVMDKDKVIYDRKKSITSATDTLFTQQQVFPNARAWNAETPNTYTLVVSTFDAQGKPQESFTHLFGFRTVEMMNGMQMINGQAVLFKGVNRHEHDPHPHIYEVKKVLQYIHFEPLAFTPNKIKVTNWHDFIGLEGYTLRWAVECDGKTVQNGEMDFPKITPRNSANIELPLKALPADGKEYFLTLRAFTKHEAPLVPKGHEVAIEQWELPSVPSAKTVQPVEGTLTVNRNNEALTVKGNNFQVAFSTRNGEMTELNYNGKNLIKEGLQPNFWRPLTDNDIPNRHLIRCGTWKNAGRDAKLQHIEVAEAGQTATVTATYRMEEQDADLQTLYKITPDGKVQVTMHFTPGKKPLSEMPRLGMRMILPAEYEMMTWLGRGPQETYADRKTGALIGLYNATVWEQFHPYVRAQETANHCDVRWVALRNAAGEGMLVVGEEPLSVSAWNFPMEDIEYRPSQMERRHGGSIQKKDMIWLNIDHKQMGVGGDNTWGAQVHPEYTITPHEWKYSFTLAPLAPEDDAAEQAHK